jgi:predicted transcriptional regulator
MELLWDHDSLTARQIQDKLYGESDRSQHGTVQRLLQRLEDKELVEREGRGRERVLDPHLARAVRRFAAPIDRRAADGRIDRAAPCRTSSTRSA